MSETPVRSSRRVAARRKKVIESDEEDISAKKNATCDQSEEEFTPIPKRSHRKAPTSQRKNKRPVVEIPQTINGKKSSALQKKTLSPGLTQLEQVEVPRSVSPINNNSTCQIEATPVQKEEHIGVTSETCLQFPTPSPSRTPEPAPYSEIAAEEEKDHPDDHSITEKSSSTVQLPGSPQNVLEKPLEIVLKSRSITIPIINDTESKPRTVIKYLILTNFKSYAGRQEVGPFHTSFSSVVGPNGSGKSNVIDSLLFVFGFRASKMRQGKISALIHNSAAFPNLNHCEVAVYFQEVMDQPNGPPIILPNSDLVISRRAFKNNSSKYFLNDRESNFTEVTTLLRNRGIDLDHKRFLILQGEVESIAQMKPKAANEHDDGLLEYLEDIIGTSKYKAPIEESVNQVESLNDICIEKSSRFHHVEKEKNNLEDKKNKALAYIKEENELTIKQSALYQIYIDECSNNLSIAEEATAQIQAQFDTEQERHKGNEDEIKRLNNLYNDGQKEYDMVEKESQSIAKEMAKFDQEQIKFNEKKKFLANKQKKTEKLISDSTAATTDCQLTIEHCTSEIESSCQKITEMEKQMKFEIDELATIREGLKGKTQTYSDQISEKQKALEPWNEKINQNLSAIAVAESELAILHEKANAGSIALKEIEAKIASTEEYRQTKGKELESCRSQKVRLEQNVNEVQSELDELAKNGPEIRSKLSTARQKADEARASLSSTQTQGNVLTGLMRLKESGRIDGFHGRLGNLGTIDQKYDVAISTACAALNNFVTDTVEGAQQCIEYLRKTNLGRGNFMCLDKIEVRDMNPIHTPENVPRLFDLIKAKDEKFRPAFYHSLQNTLVAQDLTQANRIAYGARRWRVVTLNGQLIDKSGTMSGGGNTVKKGLMSSKLIADTSKDQVIGLESDRDVLECNFQKFLERQKQLEASLSDLNDQIPQLDTKIQKIVLELESSAKNLADSQRRIQDLSKEHQPSKTDDARVKSLGKVIAQLNGEIEKLRGESFSVENEIKALQEKIMEIGGEKLRAQKIKVDSLKEEINSVGEKISAAELNRAKAEKQRTKQEKNYNKAVKDNEATIIDLQKLEQEINDQSSNAHDYESKIAEIHTNLKEKKKGLKSLKAELDEKISSLNEMRAVEIEMRNKLEENQKILNENRCRLKYWTEKLGKLTLQNVSDLGEESEMLQVLPEYTQDELAGMSKETLKSEIAALEEKTQNANIDLGVLAEYRRRVEEYAARNTDLQDAVAQRDAAKKRSDELRNLRLQGFMEGFATISLRLKEMYQMITMGGNAELELVDSLDPFSEGILFSVMPPKKSWKNISNLSGGEKTLSSLALVFALHHYKPTPLYVMDEIDAALDFRNVSIVANYIKERTKNAQFIVISLRNNMFELATRLVGVYKVNHMTKSVTIENKDYINGTE